jgi:hypothetical protein
MATHYIHLIMLAVLFGCANHLAAQRTIEGYVHVKYDLYTDTNGVLYEKEFHAIDDPAVNSGPFFDSTMFFPDYPDEVSLRRIIDIASYHEYEDTPFSKDKNNVYFVRGTSDGKQRFIMNGADPKTFIPLPGRWSKDGQHVFWNERMVEGADVSTFKVDASNEDAAFDQHSAFLNGERVGSNER